MEFTQFDVSMETDDDSGSDQSEPYNAYVNREITTIKEGQSPNKNKWAIVPLLYKDAVDDRSRWPELGIGPKGFKGIEDDLNMFAGVDASAPQIGSMDVETQCVPISFRIRSDVFDDTTLSRFNKANQWMKERWIARMGGVNDSRYDCSFATLALLDIPVSEFIRGQDFIMGEGVGLTSSMLDFQYSSISNGKTLLGTHSVLPMNKISYLWHYSEYYNSKWGKWLDDLYGSIPPYSGIVLLVQHRGGGHFCVLARGKYKQGSFIDYKTCYLLDAQRDGKNAYNRGKQSILKYLNDLGVYYMAVSCLRTEQPGLGECEDDLVNLLPFEFDRHKNLTGFSGFNKNGIPLRPVRHVSDIYGEISTMKMGMYTGRYKKKKKRTSTKKNKMSSKLKKAVSSLRRKNKKHKKKNERRTKRK